MILLAGDVKGTCSQWNCVSGSRWHRVTLVQLENCCLKHCEHVYVCMDDRLTVSKNWNSNATVQMSGISVAELVSILWNVIWPNDLAVPRATIELCRRSFSVAAPVLRNICTCPTSPKDSFGVDWKTASFSRPTKSGNLVLKSVPNCTELSALQFSSLDVPDMIVW